MMRSPKKSFGPQLAGLLLALALACAIGCSSKNAENSGSAASAPAAPAGPVLKLDPSTTGTISGTVTLSGTPPTFSALDMSAAPPCLKLNSSRVPPIVTVGPHGALANVVVYLKSGLGNYQFTAPTNPVVLDQKGCMYTPRVIAVETDQPFEVQNEDPVLHNIHVILKQNKSWTQSQVIGGPPVMATFTQPEFASRIVCNIHPWMRSYLFVFANPYFAVTGTDGKFELKDVPPGTYTLGTWQEKFGTQEQTVTLGPKDSKSVDFEYKSTSAGN